MGYSPYFIVGQKTLKRRLVEGLQLKGHHEEKDTQDRRMVGAGRKFYSR
jgi:hypothetical protein